MTNEAILTTTTEPSLSGPARLVRLCWDVVTARVGSDHQAVAEEMHRLTDMAPLVVLHALRELDSVGWLS